MDDLKTYAKDDNQQSNMLTVAKKFSDDIQMGFGLEKSAKAAFKRVKLTETSDLHMHQRTRARGGLQVPWNK